MTSNVAKMLPAVSFQGRRGSVLVTSRTNRMRREGAVAEAALLSSAARSVALIARPGRPAGTGFLVGDDLLVTCRHVLPDLDAVREATVVFGYLGDDVQRHQPKRYGLAPEVFYRVSSAAEDWAVVRVAGGARGQVNALWGALALKRSAAPGVEVRSVHHALGGPTAVSRGTRPIARVDGAVITHDLEMGHGASGAPLFDRDWSVVGVHVGTDDRPDGRLVRGVREVSVGQTVDGLLEAIADARWQPIAAPPRPTLSRFGGDARLHEVFPGYFYIFDVAQSKKNGELVVESTSYTEHWFMYTTNDTNGTYVKYVFPGDGSGNTSTSVSTKFSYQSSTLPFTPGNQTTLTSYRNGLPAHQYNKNTVTTIT